MSEADASRTIPRQWSVTIKKRELLSSKFSTPNSMKVLLGMGNLLPRYWMIPSSSHCEDTLNPTFLKSKLGGNVATCQDICLPMSKVTVSTRVWFLPLTKEESARVFLTRDDLNFMLFHR